MSDMHKRHILITNHLGACIYNNLFQWLTQEICLTTFICAGKFCGKSSKPSVSQTTQNSFFFFSLRGILQKWTSTSTSCFSSASTLVGFWRPQKLPGTALHLNAFLSTSGCFNDSQNLNKSRNSSSIPALPRKPSERYSSSRCRDTQIMNRKKKRPGSLCKVMFLMYTTSCDSD